MIMVGVYMGKSVYLECKSKFLGIFFTPELQSFYYNYSTQRLNLQLMKLSDYVLRVV